ncbi:hypothetical protein HJFPF1_05760 [Paramyrothecium foliicola]|nr:hypothetical protein HJFPF1_05760 [Paramyrothecium foliicola]
MSLLKIITSFALLQAGAVALPYSQCSEISLDILATAENLVWYPTPDLGDESAVLDFYYAGFNGTGPPAVATQTISQNYTMHGTYCQPIVQNNLDTLQVLVHGISYNKSMWSGLGFGPQYDWHIFANSQGYHTLAIDRLAHGSNTHFPNPLEVIQGPMLVESLHEIIHIARNQFNNPLGRTFSRIALISHSYGGWVATGLVADHPTDVDALVLTGFSNTPNHTVLANAKLRSAARVAPERFAHLSLGHITLEDQAEREASFYDPGGYDTAIPIIDYMYQDTWTIGQTGSLEFAARPLNYTGGLFVVTGVQDKIFCEEPIERCETLLQETGGFYPNASSFGYYALDNTGHALTLHYSAALAFQAVHEFLFRYLSQSG